MSIWTVTARCATSSNRKMDIGSGQLLGANPLIGNASEQLFCINPFIGNDTGQLFCINPFIGNGTELLFCINPFIGNGMEQPFCLNLFVGNGTEQLFCLNPFIGNASEQLLGATDNKEGEAKQPSDQLKPDSGSVTSMELLLPCAVELLHQHVHQFQSKPTPLAFWGT